MLIDGIITVVEAYLSVKDGRTHSRIFLPIWESRQQASILLKGLITMVITNPLIANGRQEANRP